MSPVEAASSAVTFLTRFAPRGVKEEQELLQVIQALSSFSNSGKHMYTNKSTIAAS
jgi:hypothetical protein